MTILTRRPSIVRPLWGHPILRAQSCWFCANDNARVPEDVLLMRYANGSVLANVHIGQSPYGRGWGTSSSINGHISLGSTNRFISGTTSPFTIAWTEWHIGAGGTWDGIACLFPSGGTPSTKSFGILRSNQTTLTTSTYGRMSIGAYASGLRLAGFLALPDVNKNIPLTIIVTAAGGAYSTTPSDFNAYWHGGRETGMLSGNAPTGATENYFGWDSYATVNRFSGVIDNLRVWNRVLDIEEIDALVLDPYLGCARGLLDPVVLIQPAAGGGSADQSRFFIAA